ncbi:MAG: flagellar biosynthesis regulatory protein FlaF [Rhodospirillales bacterium]|nr:MAG: flagellar biosynthesis regulatory protein FlaF [Rhodospirillales bacterium]
MPKEKISAYQDIQKSGMSPREVEAMALTKAAFLLQEAQKDVDNYQAFSQALRFNHLLWTIIQTDITDKNNNLPPELKANIMSLSIFVDKQTAKALAEGTAQLLDVLININRNLAEGLRVTPPGAAPAEPPPAPSQPSGGGGSITA